MDARTIHPTAPIKEARKVCEEYPTSSINEGHGNSSANVKSPLLDNQHPLEKIPVVKRPRTLELLRKYIVELHISKYSVTTNYRGLEIGSDPSVTDDSSYGMTQREARTFSSVGSSISGPRSGVLFVDDGSELRGRGYGGLLEDLRARKALMRWIGSCAACSRTKRKCLLTHHDFKSLLEDPITDDQAREDIKWVEDHFATDSVHVRSTEDFLASFDVLPDILIGRHAVRGDILEKVNACLEVLPASSKRARSVGDSYLYPQTLDIPDEYSLSGPVEVPEDPTKKIPHPFLVIIQSFPGGPIEFLPPDGSANFVSAVHAYDQSDDILEIKVGRIIATFEKWRGFFCPIGHAERRLDLTLVETIKDASSTGMSCSTCSSVRDEIFEYNQQETSLAPVTATEVADESCLSDASSIILSIDPLRDQEEKPSSADILQGYISFCQNTGFTRAAPSSGSSSKSKSDSPANDTATTQTSLTTVSSKKRARSVDGNSSDRHEDSKIPALDGFLDHEADGGLSFICPFLGFSLIMRYGCSCSNRNFRSMNSLRAHILQNHNEFQCKDCHEIFPTEMTLDNHKYNRCDKVFLCKQCFQGFPNAKKLENHWCRKIAVPRCRQCLERFPSQDQKVTHEESGCTYTPSPEFRIVDDILSQEIKNSLCKKNWTFANEQDNDKKAWINNNINKFSGELSHKQRELIKWISLWECFPFAKSIPDSPFRDLTIPTSDVQINEIMRKVKETMRINLLGDDHPLSTDSEKQEEQVTWFLDSLISTLGQFANLPKRQVSRRAKRTRKDIHPTDRTPMTSNKAMFEAVNNVMSDTDTNDPEPSRRVKQGLTTTYSNCPPIPLLRFTPPRRTLSPLSSALLLSDQTQISNQSVPLNQGYAYNTQEGPAQHSFTGSEQLIAQEHHPESRHTRSVDLRKEVIAESFSSLPHRGYSNFVDSQMPNSGQLPVDRRQQSHGKLENYKQPWSPFQPAIGGVDLTCAWTYGISPLFNSYPNEAQYNPPSENPPFQPDGTISSHQFVGLNRFSYMGSQYGADISPGDSHEPELETP